MVPLLGYICYFSASYLLSHLENKVCMSCFWGCLWGSLELELSGELVLSLLQLLSVLHMLIIHVLNLRFDGLQLVVQLGGETQRQTEGETGWGVADKLVSSLLQLGYPWQRHWRHWCLENRPANGSTPTFSCPPPPLSGSFLRFPPALLSVYPV